MSLGSPGNIRGGIPKHSSSSHSPTGVAAGSYDAPTSFDLNEAGHVTGADRAWSSTRTYAANAITIGSDSNLYISLVAGNLNNDPVLDPGTNWKQFESYILESLTAGAALTKTGNQLDWNPDNSTLEVSSDQARLKDAGVTIAKLAKKPQCVVTWSGWAPSATGADPVTTVQIPYDSDGISSVTWTMRRAYVFLSTAPSGSAFELNFEYDTGTSGAFTSDGNLLTSNISIAIGNARGSATSAGFAVTTLQSGNLMRVAIPATGSAVIAFVQLEMARLS